MMLGLLSMADSVTPPPPKKDDDYKDENHVWHEDEIFVFGSNLAGIHGAGAAKFAYEHCGAKWGFGNGLCGKSYAIPTKKLNVKDSLTLEEISAYVEYFVSYTKKPVVLQLRLKFFLTAIGTGLAGFTDEEIAPLFAEVCQENVRVPPQWKGIIERIRAERGLGSP